MQLFKGDIFKTHAKHIAHGCNAKYVMGSGLAYMVKAIYPQAYYQYVYEKPVLGTIQVVDCGRVSIVNCITQNNYGRDRSVRYASYDAIDSCMLSINDNIKADCIAMPKIGCGLGNADWNVVKEIINCRLTNIEALIYEI